MSKFLKLKALCTRPSFIMMDVECDTIKTVP